MCIMKHFNPYIVFIVLYVFAVVFWFLRQSCHRILKLRTLIAQGSAVSQHRLCLACVEIADGTLTQQDRCLTIESG